MSELSPEELTAYRQDRLNMLVSGALEPLAGYMDRLDNDAVLERLDRAIAQYDILLRARKGLTVQMGATTNELTTADAGGESEKVLSQLREQQERTVEQLQQVCSELNSAIANGLMYGQIACDRKLLGD